MTDKHASRPVPLGVKDLRRDDHLQLQCTFCHHRGLVPSYVLFACAGRDADLASLTSRFKCAGCGYRGHVALMAVIEIKTPPTLAESDLYTAVTSL